MNIKQRLTLLESRLRSVEHKVYEAKQVGTIYHVCSLKDYLKYILPNDELRASGKYYNFAYGGDDFVSFTRDKGFVLESRDDDTVLVQLVVDGDKLSENYKVRPYNDFAFGEDGEAKEDDFRKREMEECVRGPIKNISKYIKEVRFDIAAQHDLTQESDIGILKRKKKTLKDLVYHRFIRGRGADLGLPDGSSLKDVLKILDKWLDDQSKQEMLFSYDEDEIEEAIDAGANVNMRSGADGYPLEYYCEDDSSSDIIQKLLDAGANPNIKVKNGSPLLSYTIDCMCDTIAKQFIDAGADINAKDPIGKTPIMHAAEADSVDSVKALLKAGANVNARDNRNQTALSLATDNRVRRLLEKAGAVE